MLQEGDNSKSLYIIKSRFTLDVMLDFTMRRIKQKRRKDIPDAAVEYVKSKI